jgi:hypothetical protein
MVLIQYVDERGDRTRMVSVIPGREIAASTTSPDLTVGLNVVRWEGGGYHIGTAVTD